MAGAKVTAAPPASTLAVTNLLVDGVPAPMGLHNPHSRLSWQVVASDKAVRQVAYRVGVASSAEKASRRTFDLWDSGKVTSDKNFDIGYAGRPLPSRQRAWWQVTVWTETGATATSDLAFWEMGLLSPEDWTGKWIAAEDSVERADREAGLFWMGEPGDAQGSRRTFRLAFDLESAAEVTIFLAGTGKIKLELDRRAIALPPIDPNAWCPPSPLRVPVPLSAGRHEALLAVEGKEAPPRGALLIRARFAGGRVQYFDCRGAQTRVGWPSDSKGDGRTDSWSAVKTDPLDLAPMPQGAAYLLRRPFEVRGTVETARLYVTALGLYEAELNGARVGDALLTPEFTDYRKTVRYAVHDVHSALRQGENVLGTIVGEGWYASRLSPSGRYAFGPAPLRCFAQLEIRYSDGRTQVVHGDEHWAIARAPITACGIYDGETYDARLELPGWSAPGFSEGPEWQRAAIAEPPSLTCQLTGAVVPPIRRTAVLAPRSINRVGAGRIVVDFGQNFAGWVRLQVSGPAGQQVVMRFAELLNDDGSIDQSNLRGALATDTYILRGDAGGETYEPRFTYHGFRYVEISGLKRELDPKDISGVVIHSDLAETGSLTLASYIPQRLWQNGLWSQRSNFVGIPTDCPQRDERLGWMGDAHVFWDAAAYNMDVAAFTNRFMTDVADAQHADGGYSDIAPDPSLGKMPATGSSPGWADAGIILPWTVWWRYGDTAIVDQHWRSMSRFMDSIRVGNSDLIWRRGRGSDYADWLALDAKQPGDPTTPKDLVATAMWKAAADAMADMAQATGRSQEASAYRALSQGITRAFAGAFVASDGTIGNGSQTGYILALHFQLISGQPQAAARRNLVEDIRRRGTLLSTGFLGTPYSLDALADAGESRLLYDLLLREQFPSWGYMIAKQATTIWERWNGDAGDRSMNSFNHYALGAVGGFLWRRIAGIDATAPGFARFRFDPIYDSRLRRGGGRYQSRAGLITTQWEFDDERNYRLSISVPANTQAEVILPTRAAGDIRMNGRAFPQGLAETKAGRRLSLSVSSGEHAFDVRRMELY